LPIYIFRVAGLLSLLVGWGTYVDAGEPAREFLSQLRAAGYFEMAAEYLDRLENYPGVDAELIRALPLEKAQTYIDAAVAARQLQRRDELFSQAEAELEKFIAGEEHPRQSEARNQLGRLQMVRADQLHTTADDEAAIAEARESYLAAAKTFDAVTETLREKLLEMRGAKIDPAKNPEAAALRDRYRGEFLQAMSTAGQARLLAAQTYDDPAAQAKALLESALAAFTELSDKYDGYVLGAMALAYRGEVQTALGQTEQAIDSFIDMLEQPDADPLRDAKFRAAAGLARVYLGQTPPDYQAAIDRAEPLAEDIRADEKTLPSVQLLRLELARALLAKAADEQNQNSAAVRRAKSAARRLLMDARMVPGPQGTEAGELLAGMGVEISDETPELPSAEPPENLAGAVEKARTLLATTQQLQQSIEMLRQQAGEDPSVIQQRSELENQLTESRGTAVFLLRHGLALVTSDSDPALMNQARHILTHLLYQQQRYRPAAATGQFLTRTAAGTDAGLQGGLLALNSLQLLLVDDPDNAGLASQLEELGTYLTATWPHDPRAAAGQDVMFKLALRGNQYDRAEQLIAKLGQGPARLAAQRLMGRVLWGDSITQRAEDDTAAAETTVRRAEKLLRGGLENIEGKLAGEEVMKSALALSKVYLQLDQVNQAAATLEHEIYGPLTLAKQQGMPDQAFAADLYSTELQVVVQLMTADGSDPQKLLDRASKVMGKLRESIEGNDAGQRLTAIYVRMAREIRLQLDRANPDRRVKLIEAFRVFLERIAGTTEDPATLQWTAQTLIELAEASMAPNQVKANGQAAKLLTTAVDTFQQLKEQSEAPPLVIDYLLGRCQRLLGNFKQSIDTLAGLLSQQPMMLDAQVEAALAYEQWAATVPPKFTANAYRKALSGGRPGGDGKNVIWGWGKISQLTVGKPQHKEVFFDARYHVALCRFLLGKAQQSQAVMEKAASDITRLQALYPDLGGAGQTAKFDELMKTIQKQLGKPLTGLPKKQAK